MGKHFVADVANVESPEVSEDPPGVVPVEVVPEPMSLVASSKVKLYLLSVEVEMLLTAPPEA